MADQIPITISQVVEEQIASLTLDEISELAKLALMLLELLKQKKSIVLEFTPESDDEGVQGTLSAYPCVEDDNEE